MLFTPLRVKCSGKKKGPEGPSLDIYFEISLRGSVTPAGVQDLDYSRQLVRIHTRSRTVLYMHDNSSSGYRQMGYQTRLTAPLLFGWEYLRLLSHQSLETPTLRVWAVLQRSQVGTLDEHFNSWNRRLTGLLNTEED